MRSADSPHCVNVRGRDYTQSSKMPARNLKMSRNEVLRTVVLDNFGNEDKMIGDEIRKRLTAVVQGEEEVIWVFFCREESGAIGELVRP